ncbi:hypothetical protein [Lederbergia lenta]|uniref:Uncharacterized protein n=1 Tax=Lederbergia lenta TaxID=1467 RepID=A0A2X4WIW2_LEDLE|nr:hypothetical protein [Lederbergia lenta]MCM3109791.1 hypothetical protein [Lederbergia lenta]MEC2324459.1 hypothetical protein [Lederbergia lenta]SQI59818.1 Uncharacterised protein [Lederbergia lenta]
MDWNDNGNVDVEKAKFLTKIGCFIWIVLGILFFSYQLGYIFHILKKPG